MIKNSFIFLENIGQKKEQQFWEQNILCWDDFLKAQEVRGIGKLKKLFFDRRLLSAKQALHDQDAEYFSRLLPQQECWRLYNEFKDETLFLDIETAGFYGNITVIGLYDGFETKMMIRGINLDKEILRKELEKYKLLVTFNGSSFDLPVIKRYFGDVIPCIPHIDLRGVCSKIGLRGGLKSIENQLGIERPDDIKYIYGTDAVWLWHKYRHTGDEKYLQTLIRYNEEDIMNLKPIAERVIKELWEKRFWKNIS
ncbi:MAG: ribonuclease H-like domain-containing protein [Nanoarchaeota archaeon]